MKKKLCLLLIIAMILPIFSGCAKTIDNSGYIPTGDAIVMEGQDPEDIMPTEEDTQELVLAYYPTKSLNPVFGSDYTNRVLMSLMYQGLFAVDNKKNPTPMLASGWRSTAGNRTWVVYLDPNATFSDGSRVTNQDVIATYTKAKENDYYSGRFKYHLSDVKESDDGGVAFYMNTAFENLPMILDIPIVKASQVDFDGKEDIPLGTGPYTFEKGMTGGYLQRNLNWWCGKTKIPATDETIELVEVESPAQVRDEFQFGKVSLACTNPMSASFAEYRCDYELWEIESGYFMYLGCNILYSDFFKDGKLRTFLTYAIDRETMAQKTYRGMVDPVTLPTSPRELTYNKTLAAKYGYDSMKFLSNLGSFSIPTEDKGGDQVFEILVNSQDSARVQIARSLAATLTELGMKSTTVEYSGGTFRNVIAAGNYDVYLGMTRLSPTMDLSEFFRPWGELGWGGLAHESLLSMCTHALENSGNFYNLYQKLGEDGRMIPVMFGYYVVYAQRGLIPELNPSRDNVFYYSLGRTMEETFREVESE